MVAYYPVWPGDPARIAQSTAADSGLNAWFMEVTANALAHGHNIFFTPLLDYPHGVNLTYNTQMPLLGVLAAPLTLTAGPVASLNLLLYLALPLSAVSMFLVLRRWTTWTPAAFAGGLLYGFSPYMVGQSTAHLNLTFVPLPPLILLALVELLVRRSGHALRWGLVLGAAVAAQFLISPEVLVTTGLMMIVGLVILAVARPAAVVPALRGAAGGLACGLVVTAAVLAWPVTEYVAGPQHVVASATDSGTFLLRTDLLGPIIPTSFDLVAPHRLAAYGDRLTVFRDYSENGAYLGLPLLLALAYLAARAWRDRWIRMATVMAAISFLLSLGGSLSVGGHDTGIPLPAELLRRVPLVDQLVPARISLLTALFAAIVAARGIDALRRARQPDADRAGNGHSAQSVNGSVLPLVVGAVVVMVVVASLLPRWPNTTVPTSVPGYFTSHAVDHLPAGTLALTYPFPTPLHAQPMVWQAESGLRFSLIGGYAFVADRHGDSTPFPPILAPPAVEKFLINEVGGVPFFDSDPGVDDAAVSADLKAFVSRYPVGVVLVDPSAPHAARVTRVFTQALGASPVSTGGMEVWTLPTGTAHGTTTGDGAP